MFFKKYINKLLDKIFIQNLNKNPLILLNKNIVRFTYIACAISGENMEILKSNDKYSSYYEKKIILPKKVNFFEKNDLNFLYYVYIILFLLTARNLYFYLSKNKNNLDYILLNSILTVKTINRYICKEYIKIKYVIRVIYNNVISTRPNIYNLNGRAFFLEILIRKLMYQRLNLNIKLNKEESEFLYIVENVHTVTSNDLNDISDKLYHKLCILYNNYQNIELNIPWGYFYYKEKRKIQGSLKEKIKYNSSKEKLKLDKNILIKNQKNINKKENKNSINSLFDYKKTIENYQNQKNKYVDKNDIDNLDIIKNINTDYTIRDNSNIKTNFSLNIVNKLIINNLYDNECTMKKFVYKEWNHNNKRYLNNWCNIFEKKEKTDYISEHEKTLLNIRFNNYKKEINTFKNMFNFIMNKKTWKSGQRSGEDIDLDMIIDNYKHIRENNFDKLYKYKKNTQKDLCIIILFDSSLSTDSYTENNKTLEFLKDLVLILGCTLDSVIKYFSVVTFYSNTRHDCKYVIIKDFKDKWNKQKYILEKVFSNGYTRIGPAIRHATYKLKKMNVKQKLILLLSDAKPTDYDEYEGIYGINDVRYAINEAKVDKIYVKSMIIDNSFKSYFQKMFGFKNYNLLSGNKNISLNLIKLFNNFK